MFCTNCGASIPENNHFCEQCGTPVSGGTQASNAAPALNPAFAASNVAEDESPRQYKFRLIAKIALLIALVGFFMPFATVSCNYSGTETKIVSYTGMELLAGVDFDAADSDLSYAEDYQLNLNPFLLLSFLLGLAAIVQAFLKRKLVPWILTAISAGMLLLYQISFKSFYNFGENANSQYLEIHVEGGFITCLIMFVVATALMLLADADRAPALPPGQ